MVSLKGIVDKNAKVSELSDRRLKYVEELMHSYWRIQNKGLDRPKGWTKEDIGKLHARTVEELNDRDLEHSMDEELDRYSLCFSDKVDNKEILVLKDVLENFKSFKTDKTMIWLCGQMVDKGKTKGKVNLLIGKEEPANSFEDVLIKTKILNMFPKELWHRVNFIYWSPETPMPFKNYIKLYEVDIKRCKDYSVVQIIDVPETNSTKVIKNEEIMKQKMFGVQNG